jgi:signal recognition particle GTPase
MASQLSKASKLGSVASMLPESMRGGLTKEAAQRASEVYTLQVKIVGAMTADEKAVPAKISLDAKKRIALKAGTTPQAVTDTLGKWTLPTNTTELTREWLVG